MKSRARIELYKWAQLIHLVWRNLYKERQFHNTDSSSSLPAVREYHSILAHFGLFLIDNVSVKFYFLISCNQN